MLSAAKEEIPAWFGDVCADLPLAADADLVENSRQGSATKNSTRRLSFELCNSTTALGLRGTLALERVRKNDSARYYSPQIGRFLSEAPAGFAGSGPNLYAYVHNDPVKNTDPLGLWDTYTHSALLWLALKPCGVSNNDIWEMQQASASLDAWTQDPGSAYMHSMKAPFQSAADALAARDGWINANLDYAQYAYGTYQALNGGDGNYVNYTQQFAFAAHTLTDETSPAHMQDGVPITWPSNISQHGDFPGSIETWNDMTSALLQQNIDAIQKAWEQVTGKKCGCHR